MSIYQKLKAIDLADITDAALATHINTVLSFADQESELDDNERAQVEKVYNRAVVHLNKKMEQAAEEKRKREEEESEEQQELQRQQQAIDEIEAMDFRHIELLKHVKDKTFQKRQGAWLMLLGRLKKKPFDEAAKQAVIANSEKLAQDIEAHLQAEANKEKEKLTAEETKKAELEAKKKAEEDAANQAQQAEAQKEADRIKAEQDAAQKIADEKAAKSTGNVYLDTIFGR